MNYLEIDFNKVKGYNELSETGKKVFERVYKQHNTMQGTDYKEDWKPTKAKEHKTYLEVHFANGQWLHYMPDGSWY